MVKYKRCRECQKFFTPLRADQKYCRTKCRRRYRKRKQKETVVKRCKQCKRKFSTNLLKQYFCSDECRKEYYSIKNKEIEKRCLHCGKLFKTTDTRRKYHKDCAYPAKLIKEHERYINKKGDKN